MTLETKTDPPSAGSSAGEGEVTTKRAQKTIESSTYNGGQWQGRCGCEGRSSHQGYGGRGGCFNRPAYTSSIINFKGEVEDFGAVLGNTAYQREAKDQYKKFIKNLKQYVILYFQHPQSIIFLVWDVKPPMTVLDTSKSTAISTQDEKYTIMVIIQNK